MSTQFPHVMEKVARYISAYPGDDYDWTRQFKGSPFYKEALGFQKDDAKQEALRARRRAAQEKEYAEEALHRVGRIELEAKLAEWKYQQMGIGKTAAAALAKFAAAR